MVQIITVVWGGNIVGQWSYVLEGCHSWRFGGKHRIFSRLDRIRAR